MNALYNLFLGRKISSTVFGNDDDADDARNDEVLDENGFVMVKSDGNCIQVSFEMESPLFQEGI